ncbi:chemotaxis protein MotB [Kineococcus xinjiangensis]|uniref:Chemotaxis protein MotB n=1 Tax=Kineococcus xinjiangensis TaxID=512762 RepID=A0A2S6IJW4_9ACTN|nr:flagellar motor protein MotB [Kineococcus xinjiangensis]PPK94522.1 chemotaxis protein MotB [Kineococcus xinjiangensis]
MSSGKRRHKHEEHDEHVNHERWLVSYADMLTVLMALFIVLFALSQVDQLKFAQFKAGLTEGFSTTNVAITGEEGINDAQNGQDPMSLEMFDVGDPLQPKSVERMIEEARLVEEKELAAGDLEAARAEVENYREIIKRIDAALAADGNQDQVTYRITADGLIVGLVADKVFFANASADVERTGLEVLDAIGPILAGLPNDIAVQGHTNSLPLKSTSRFRDNWDLSSGRANSVVTRFIGVHQLAERRLSSTGFGQTRPLYPDGDPAALAGNRRVDLVVASPSSDAVRALLPEVAASLPTDGPAELHTPADAEAKQAAEAEATTGDAAPDLVLDLAPEFAEPVVAGATHTSTTAHSTPDTHSTETATGGH